MTKTIKIVMMLTMAAVKMIIILSPHVWLDIDEDKETPSRDKGDHQHEFQVIFSFRLDWIGIEKKIHQECPDPVDIEEVLCEGGVEGLLGRQSPRSGLLVDQQSHLVMISYALLKMRPGTEPRGCRQCKPSAMAKILPLTVLVEHNLESCCNTLSS